MELATPCDDSIITMVASRNPSRREPKVRMRGMTSLSAAALSHSHKLAKRVESLVGQSKLQFR